VRAARTSFKVAMFLSVYRLYDMLRLDEGSLDASSRRDVSRGRSARVVCARTVSDR
jgi:hypothetical protein